MPGCTSIEAGYLNPNATPNTFGKQNDTNVKLLARISTLSHFGVIGIGLFLQNILFFYFILNQL